jgi:hypothetical protein
MVRGEEKCRPCQGLGYPGILGHFNNVAGQLTEDIQQLLSIWNRAKGKERDALLWGDEVRQNIVRRARTRAYKSRLNISL